MTEETNTGTTSLWRAIAVRVNINPTFSPGSCQYFLKGWTTQRSCEIRATAMRREMLPAKYPQRAFNAETKSLPHPSKEDLNRSHYVLGYQAPKVPID